MQKFHLFHDSLTLQTTFELPSQRKRIMSRVSFALNKHGVCIRIHHFHILVMIQHIVYAFRQDHSAVFNNAIADLSVRHAATKTSIDVSVRGVHNSF